MLKIWEAANFRRTLGGICLILAPLVFAVVEIGSPHSDDLVTELDIAAKQHTTVLVYDYLGLLASLLFIAATFALLQVITRRGVVLGHVAAILTVLGMGLSGLALGGARLIFWAMSSPGVDQQAMKAFLRSLMESGGAAAAPLIGGHQLFAIGLILFGIALWRAGFRPRWAGPVLALAVIIDIVGGSTPIGSTELGDRIVSAVSDAGLIAGLGAVGVRLLGMRDSELQASEPAPRERPTSTVAANA